LVQHAPLCARRGMYHSPILRSFACHRRGLGLDGVLLQIITHDGLRRPPVIYNARCRR
jgi:hypothetical protein